MKRIDGPIGPFRETMTPAERKARPLYSGCLAYFPDALLEVAYCSKLGNDQHNPGEPLHWAKGKSQDEPDAEARHLLDREGRDSDGVRHAAKKAWRALADLQRMIDAEREERDRRLEEAKALECAGGHDGAGCGGDCLPGPIVAACGEPHPLFGHRCKLPAGHAGLHSH